MQSLNATLVQCELAWEEPHRNREQIETVMAAAPSPTDLFVLPEMFSTGFSMNAVGNAEKPGGPTEMWMQHCAQQFDCAVAGSIAVIVDGKVYNRFLFITPQQSWHYDKRHLFRMAGEHKRYSAGEQRVVANWRGWRILLQVCYDLRFPVFSRNLGDYDLALYVANWPDVRARHWRQLLIARAIENQSCVIGVNRVGSDARGINYQGDSLAVAADGKLLLDMARNNNAAQVTLDGSALESYRREFPSYLDADSFNLL